MPVDEKGNRIAVEPIEFHSNALSRDSDLPPVRDLETVRRGRPDMETVRRATAPIPTFHADVVPLEQRLASLERRIAVLEANTRV